MNVIQFLKTETMRVVIYGINLATVVMNVFGHHSVKTMTCLETVCTRF